MPDDKIKMDQRDRSKVAAGEDYEVALANATSSAPSRPGS
jgi:hypothetical protein